MNNIASKRVAYEDYLMHSYVYDYDDYLMHYGVAGQKWGKRRWQNEDGSLTPAGYAHYGITGAGKRGIKRIERDKSKAYAYGVVNKLKKRELTNKLSVAKAKGKVKKVEKLQNKINKVNEKIKGADITRKKLSELQTKNIEEAKKVWNVAKKETIKDVYVNKGRNFLISLGASLALSNDRRTTTVAYAQYVRTPHTKYKFYKKQNNSAGKNNGSGYSKSTQTSKPKNTSTKSGSSANNSSNSSKQSSKSNYKRVKIRDPKTGKLIDAEISPEIQKYLKDRGANI